MNVLILGKTQKFNKNLSSCLGENHKIYIKNNFTRINRFFSSKKIDVVVFNVFNRKIGIKKDLEKILKYNFKKFIFLEDAEEIYFNSKNPIPYSVYEKIEPKNKKCERRLEIEEFIVGKKKNSVIFRVSDIYGPNINFGIIYDLLYRNKISLSMGKRDFLYEGDLIQAIEVATETDANGIFDLAFGESVKIKSQLIRFIKKYRKKNIKIDFSKRKNLEYNCENFKFYKWKPVVKLEVGLKVITMKGIKNGKI